MKANELMIGDWVSYDGHNTEIPHGYVRVSCIARDMRELCVNDKETTYDFIHPIPLTAEILEKNGWEKEVLTTICVDYTFIIGCCDMMVRITNGNAFLELSIFRGAKISMNIHSVHELQHALRLCGLNDLADNFRV